MQRLHLAHLLRTNVWYFLVTTSIFPYFQIFCLHWQKKFRFWVFFRISAEAKARNRLICWSYFFQLCVCVLDQLVLRHLLWLARLPQQVSQKILESGTWRIFVEIWLLLQSQLLKLLWVEQIHRWWLLAPVKKHSIKIIV